MVLNGHLSYVSAFHEINSNCWRTMMSVAFHFYIETYTVPYAKSIIPGNLILEVSVISEYGMYGFVWVLIPLLVCIWCASNQFGSYAFFDNEPCSSRLPSCRCRKRYIDSAYRPAWNPKSNWSRKARIQILLSMPKQQVNNYSWHLLLRGLLQLVQCWKFGNI